MVPADSDGIPRVPPYSGYRYARSCFVYGAITRYGRTFQNVLLTITVQQRGPTTPTLHCYSIGLGSSPVARHYWGNHCLFSFPGGTKMFQFPPLASIHKVWMTVLQTAGLSHSEIRGSKITCIYPQLIAACHVLLRLREPRHPPCALSYFFWFYKMYCYILQTLILSAIRWTKLKSLSPELFELQFACVNMSKIFCKEFSSSLVWRITDSNR